MRQKKSNGALPWIWLILDVDEDNDSFTVASMYSPHQNGLCIEKRRGRTLFLPSKRRTKLGHTFQIDSTIVDGSVEAFAILRQGETIENPSSRKMLPIVHLHVTSYHHHHEQQQQQQQQHNNSISLSVSTSAFAMASRVKVIESCGSCSLQMRGAMGL